MAALKTIESRCELGYVFHSTHYENLETILKVRELRSLPSLIHDLGLTEEKDFKAKSGSVSSNFQRILENPQAELYQGIFASQNGIGEEASGQYFNEYLPVCFAFDFRKLLEGYAIGVNDSKDIVIYGKGEDRKAHLPISSAEAMFVSSDVYLDEGKVVEPRVRKPYLEEYARVSMKELDRLSERFDAVQAISSLLKEKGLYDEACLRLDGLFDSTLERKRFELSKEKDGERRASLERDIRSLDKCRVLGASGIRGILEMTEGQVGLILDDMTRRKKKKFKLLGKEYLAFGGENSLVEAMNIDNSPTDSYLRLMRKAFGDEPETKTPPGHPALVERLIRENLPESGSPQDAASKAKREAVVNDAALILLLATPTKFFVRESDFFEKEYKNETARFGEEFKARLKSKMSRENPFFNILLREGGDAVFRNHPQISHNYHEYCWTRGRFEEYLKGASGRTSTRELLAYLLREKGVKFKATPSGLEIEEHEKAGLPPRIILFGDKGKEDLPAAVEAFLADKGVKIPARPHSTYLGEEERKEQGARTVAWLKTHCRPAGRAHATFQEIELYTSE